MIALAKMRTVGRRKRNEPDSDSDIELCKRHRAGKVALDALVRRHGGLARTWARRFSREEQCCSQEDLFQECQRGLMDAAGHFDPERGAFSTVASIWMKKRCLAFIEKAKQFGSQSDSLGDAVENDGSGRDHSHLAKHFGIVDKLYQKQAISQTDVTILRIVCSPLESQDEMLRPLVASWWKQAKQAALSRVAKAMQVSRLEIQQEMWR